MLACSGPAAHVLSACSWPRPSLPSWSFARSWPGQVGMVSGLFFGFSFGVGGLGAAALGRGGGPTGIEFVYRLCAFLPAIGLAAALLPEIERKRAWPRTRTATSPSTGERTAKWWKRPCPQDDALEAVPASSAPRGRPATGHPVPFPIEEEFVFTRKALPPLKPMDDRSFQAQPTQGRPCGPPRRGRRSQP